MQSPGCLGGPRSQSVPRDRYCLGTRLRRPLKGTSSSERDEIAARDLLCRLSVSFHDRVLVSPHARDQRPQNERPTLADQYSRSSGHVVDFFNSRDRDSDATASRSRRHRRPPSGQERGGPRGSSEPCPGPVECYGIRQTPAAGPQRAAGHPRRISKGTVQEHTGTTAESFPNKTLLETPVLVELSALSLSGRMDPEDSASQALVGEKGEAETGVRRVAMQARTDLDRWLVISHGVSLERSWLKASRCLPLALMIAIVRRA
ncbi:hypothetical protein CMUS01_08311 [Colletotrichum musicola]|uniref:Uncharacterized protein n=1 Tax=Colletotrichum musicola TaxID=2175873 RepID=A0A8H6KD32_9PEZI|nr:hypothetical protein CMUS01_08311 [Colletotrichum musicola]